MPAHRADDALDHHERHDLVDRQVRTLIIITRTHHYESFTMSGTGCNDNATISSIVSSTFATFDPAVDPDAAATYLDRLGVHQGATDRGFRVLT